MTDAILKYVNQRGIPAIESNGIIQDKENATFIFNRHRNVNSPFAGLIVVKIRKEDEIMSSDAFIRFSTYGVENSTKQLIGYKDVLIKVSDWSGPGIYLCFYDSDTGKLHLLANLVN